MKTTTRLMPPGLLTALSILALVVTVNGCATMGNFAFGKERIPVASEKNPVVQVLAMWQAGEGPGTDGRTTRGFVGQLYFFTANSAIAAKVDGMVRVYLFDDQGTEEEQIKPLHQFDYPPESLTALGSPGKLGESYTVFIPYTRSGHHKAQCSLRVAFRPKKGMSVHSEMAYVGLPGRKQKGVAGKDGEGIGREAEDATAEEELEGAVTGGSRSGDQGPRDGWREGSELPAHLRRQLQSIDLSALRKSTQRPAGKPLTEQERERIVREMRSRGEPFTVSEADRPRIAARRSRTVVPASFEDDDLSQVNPPGWENGDSAEFADDEFEEAGPPARLSRRRPGKSRQVMLADHEEDEESGDYGTSRHQN